MVEQRRAFQQEVDRCAGIICDVLQEPSPRSQCVLAHNSIKEFEHVVSQAETESFQLICERLEKMFVRFIDTDTVPSAIEVEIIELAIDWLRQLASLYAEAIPEPRTLVAELIYAFELVERSQGAASLAELMSEKNTSDLFDDDPEMDVDSYHAPEKNDPFGNDPGFGLEFDLLQRTLNRTPIKRSIKIDPFSDDPGVAEKDPLVVQETPYDVFGDDPSVLD